MTIIWFLLNFPGGIQVSAAHCRGAPAQDWTGRRMPGAEYSDLPSQHDTAGALTMS